MRHMFVLTCMVLLVVPVAHAGNKPKLKPETVIVAQPDAPLIIEEYSAEYSEGGQYTARGIHHDVKLRSTAARPVVAYAIKFVAFNVFNEHLDNLRGYAIDTLMPGDDKSAGWVQNTYAGGSFQTGVAYVAAARFDDGTLWKADESVALNELRKIEADFEAAGLEDDGREE